MRETSVTEQVLRHDRRLLVVLIALLFALALVYTVFGIGMRMSALEMTAMGHMRDMPAQGVVPGVWSAGYALLVFLMWWIMMIAMMLPSVAPTVLLQTALLRHAGKAAQMPILTLLFLGGYLVVWAGFSALATGTQWALEAAGMVSATMMTLIETVPGGIVLIAAGVFQFTPLKAACLEHCRSPAKFLSERRRSGPGGVFVMGLEHGLYCLGCCWFLMALLFVGGIMNLYWIVGLAAFVALEKLTRHGVLMGRLAGTALVAWGAWIVFNAV
jgi:predicted metal-binding membrane protein